MGSPALALTALQGASEHPARLSQQAAASRHESSFQHIWETAEKPQSAPGQVQEAERSCPQKPNKHGESGLLAVQADSSAKAHPDVHGGVNGHHCSELPRSVPNGVCEQGGLRGGVSKEHEHVKVEHGHPASKGRPPEVEAGYS